MPRYFIYPVFLAIIVVLSCRMPVSGDVVTLKNGQKIEGATREVGENVEIRTRTARLMVPLGNIEGIEKKEYSLDFDDDENQTPEQARRRHAEDLFSRAQEELDRMNVTAGIALLEQSVEADPGYEKGIEKLIRLTTSRNDFKKAMKYIELMKGLRPLEGEWKERAQEIAEGLNRQLLREEKSQSVMVKEDDIEFADLLKQMSFANIPDSPPLDDFTGHYYIEFSFYAEIQQRGTLASVALYSTNSKSPVYQFPATVKANFLIPDLSRVNPEIQAGSVVVMFHPDRHTYSLNFAGRPLAALGRKMRSQEELQAFQALLSRDYPAAVKGFEKAITLDGGNSHALFGLGRARMLSGEMEKALETLNQLKENADFKEYFFLDNFLRISIEYSEASLMEAKGQNAFTDYEAAIRRYPQRIPDFSPFMGVLEKGEPLNSYTAEAARKLLDPYDKTFNVLQSADLKPFGRRLVDGIFDNVPAPDDSNYFTLARLLLIKSRLYCHERKVPEALLWSRRLAMLGIHLTHGSLDQRKKGIKILLMGVEAFREAICSVSDSKESDIALKHIMELKGLVPAIDFQSLMLYERVEWPTVSRAFYTEAAIQVKIDLTPLEFMTVAAAAKKYYVENNKWPVPLEMLVPDYLPSIPTDPFSRRPLDGFAHQNHFRIYSIGPDRTDDKGYTAYNPAHGVAGTGDIFMDIE